METMTSKMASALLFASLLNAYSIALLYAITAGPAENKAIDFPHFLQCDHRWGSDLMGEENCSVKTCPGAVIGRDKVCRQGCAMTSLSMALSGYGYSIDGQDANPGTLNAWLVKNGGYACVDGDCNNLELQTVQKIHANITFEGEILTSRLGLDGLLLALKDNVVLIAHVRNKTHFVLITGYTSGGNFTVLDPFYNTIIYNFADMSDVIVYGM
jgi:hypothetical protein